MMCKYLNFLNIGLSKIKRRIKNAYKRDLSLEGAPHITSKTVLASLNKTFTIFHKALIFRTSPKTPICVSLIDRLNSDSTFDHFVCVNFSFGQ